MEFMKVSEIRALERNAIWLGLSESEMMEQAGRGVAEAVQGVCKPDSPVVVLCGTGHNGGDGMVAARLLSSAGFEVRVGLLGKSQDLKPPMSDKFGLLKKMATVTVVESLNDDVARKLVEDAGCIVVALVGTGVKGPLREPLKTVVHTVNEQAAFKVAVDVPPGIDPDTGAKDEVSLRADLVVAIHARKPYLSSGLNHVVVPIGIPREAALLVGPGDAAPLIHRRKSTDRKGMAGKVLVIGGSREFSGAPALAALGAMRTGCDLAVVASPEAAAPTIRSYSPALIVHPLPGDHLDHRGIEDLVPRLPSYDSFVVGMGLGRDEETMEAVTELVAQLKETRKPFILDADALHALRGATQVGGVLTPHAGEFEALTGHPPPAEPPEGEADFWKKLSVRSSDVVKAARRLGSVVLLKGKFDVITDGNRLKLDGTGNPGMAVGGTGDVLSGVIGTFLAWGNDPFSAAVGGSFVVGSAGDLTSQNLGYHMLATDLIEQIPDVMRQLEAMNRELDGNLTS